jgi:membrane associated rhomboid family serine protease
MLIVPVFSKATKKVPYVCFALIVVNAFIFFFLQSGDDQIQEEAFAYYESSGLSDIELEAYLGYLTDTGVIVPPGALKKGASRSKYLQRMFADMEFRKQLDDGLIITLRHEQYDEWRSKSSNFSEIKDRSVISRFGYSPRENNLIGLFTCTFLHGGIMHLAGNMVFLWLVGAILEKAVGAVPFIGLYCICGICASALFGLVYPSAPGPLVGASGAIAGLMGAYGVIFGMRRIRVFYSLGFYFNYAVLPAIALFPVWLANEFFQLFTDKGSHVAYMAHIGGLLSGMAIGTGYRMLRSERIEELFQQEEQSDRLDSLLDSGQQKFLDLNIEEARRDFHKVLSIEPHNSTAIRHLFLIEKAAPQTDAFHRSAHRLLHSIKREDRDEYLQIFAEYKAASGKLRLTHEILERLAYCHLVSGNYEEAAGCIAALLKRTPQNSKLPGFLLKLAHGFRGADKQAEATKCYRILSTRYGASNEGIEAARQLSILAGRRS